MKKLFLSLFLLNLFLAVNASDGSLDSSFGAGSGFVKTANGQAQAIAVQIDGKIITAGINNPAYTDGQIRRYNGDGTIDTSFNGTGIVATADFYPHDVIIQPDGKIVAAGTDATTESKFVIVRYTASGSLDESFGEGGIISSSVGSINSVVLQADRKIITIGNSSNGPFVIRLHENGTIDTVFDQVSLDGNSVGGLIQDDGKILIAGTSNALACLVRYNKDGTIDTSYGVAGIATVPAPLANSINGVVLQTDEKVIVLFRTPPQNIAFARFDRFGTLDSSFGTGGVLSGGPADPLNVNSLVLQADNKPVFVIRDVTFTNFFSGRITNLGALDTTWGTQGFTTVPAGTGLAAGIQSNGFILGAGFSDSSFNTVVRYTSSVPMAQTIISEPQSNAQLPTGPITFSGTAQNPSIVYLLIDGAVVAGTQTGASGTGWSITIPALSYGTHTAQAIAIYQNRKLNIASEIVNFSNGGSSVCILPSLENTSPITREIIKKYYCL